LEKASSESITSLKQHNLITLPLQLLRLFCPLCLNPTSPTGQIDIMSDGALFKPERDYTKEADKVIPEAQVLAKVVHP
jgi:hypothetical protein